jgi:hypothetical protein
VSSRQKPALAGANDALHRLMMSQSFERLEHQLQEEMGTLDEEVSGSS